MVEKSTLKTLLLGDEFFLPRRMEDGDMEDGQKRIGSGLAAND